MTTVFAIFLGIVAGLMFLALLTLIVTLVVMAVRSRRAGLTRPTYRD